MIICIFAESAMPLFLAGQPLDEMEFAMEIEKENENSGKEKEEKTDNDKIPFKFSFFIPITSSFWDRRDFEDQHPSSSQVFKGVLTPPPQQLA